MRCPHWRCSCTGKSLEALSRRMLHPDPWCTDKDDWLSPLSANPLGVSKVNYSVVHAVLLSSSSMSLMYVAPSSTQTTDKLAVRQPAGAQRQTVFRGSIVHTLFLASAPIYSSGTPFLARRRRTTRWHRCPSTAGLPSAARRATSTSSTRRQRPSTCRRSSSPSRCPRWRTPPKSTRCASAPRHLLRGGRGSVSATP